MESSHDFSEEDWLVHTHYGIGQIKGIEVKMISGAKASYFRIQTSDSTFWIPVDQIDSEILRPLSTLEEIQLAIAILQRPPKKMSSDHNARKTRIRRVQLQNTPEDTARLIRDLRARQRDKGELNMEESSAIRALKQRLIEEWSLVMDKKSEKVSSRLDDLLDHHQLAAE